MLPSSSQNDTCHSAQGDSKEIRDSFIPESFWNILCSNSPYNFHIKDSVIVLLSNQIGKHIVLSRAKPFPLHSISRVVLLCSLVKMCFSYALWIVALMENPFSIRNPAMVKFPRNPMGCLQFPVMLHLSIPLILECRRPFPTPAEMWTVFRGRSIFIYSRPKSALKGFLKILHSRCHHFLIVLRATTFFRMVHTRRVTSC